MHCTAGADWTGTVCYLLNALLGVSEKDLMKDFEMTSFSIYGLRTDTSGRFMYLYILLNETNGKNLKEKAEKLLLSIGVTSDEIKSIRSILL